MKRRSLLKFASLLTALGGTSAVSAIAARPTHASPAPTRVPSFATAVASTVAPKLDTTDAALTYATKLEATPAATSAVAASREPVGVLTTGFGGAHITNSKTGEWVTITGTVTVTVTEPMQLGVGVQAIVNGMNRWLSPSGYSRPLETSFLRASLWGSSFAANMGFKATESTRSVEHGTTLRNRRRRLLPSNGHRRFDGHSSPYRRSLYYSGRGWGDSDSDKHARSQQHCYPVSWPGMCAGIPGTLSKNAGSPIWTFTRNYSGTATSVPAGSEFTP